MLSVALVRGKTDHMKRSCMVVVSLRSVTVESCLGCLGRNATILKYLLGSSWRINKTRCHHFSSGICKAWNKARATPILVTLSGLIQIFRKASPTFSYGSAPGVQHFITISYNQLSRKAIHFRFSLYSTLVTVFIFMFYKSLKLITQLLDTEYAVNVCCHEAL